MYFLSLSKYLCPGRRDIRRPLKRLNGRSFRLYTSLLAAFVLMSWTGIQAQSMLTGDTLAAAGKTGMAYPAFVLRNESGVLNSEDLRGKVIWINFWFEACKPCMAEMKAIDECVRRLRRKEDFVMISLTWEDMEAVQRVKAKFPMPYSIYNISDEECIRLNGNHGYPTNVVVDKKGIIRYIRAGGSSDSKQAEEYIRAQIYPVIQAALKE